MRWLALIFVMAAGAALAHSGATGKVKERMDGMKAMGAAMKSIGAMAQGKAAHDAAAVEAAGRQIETHAQAMAALFPKGSDHKPTRALPEVWTNGARFEALAKELADSAAQLARQASDGDALGANFRTVAEQCKVCHQRYRAPE